MMTAQSHAFITSPVLQSLFCTKEKKKNNSRNKKRWEQQAQEVEPLPHQLIVSSAEPITFSCKMRHARKVLHSNLQTSPVALVPC